ncbi:MAG: hypothetical protein RLP14_04285 [Owenweeksia sp.]
MFKVVQQAYIGLVFLMSASALNGQSDVEAEIGYLGAFNGRDLTIWNTNVSHDFSSGAYFKLGYSYLIEKVHLQPAFSIGYHVFSVKGQAKEFSYQGVSHRFSMSAGVRYWLNDAWGTGVFIDAENNRDTEDWRTHTVDLLRYSVSFRGLWRIHSSLKLIAGYRTSLYPLQEQYFLYNPPRQVFVGVNYGFL